MLHAVYVYKQMGFPQSAVSLSQVKSSFYTSVALGPEGTLFIVPSNCMGNTDVVITLESGFPLYLAAKKKKKIDTLLLSMPLAELCK